ncbi:MAG: sorbosone dehydrogenase family protein, partial [Bacteroidetes bacterium]
MRNLIILLFFLSCQNVDNEQNVDNNTLEPDHSIDVPDTHNLPINLIKLPEGFKISVYASDITNARSMALSENGVLYVGNRGEDKVYALIDENNDYKADKKYIVAEGLHMPNGVALKDGNLYVAERSKIWRFKDIDEHLNNPPEPELIYDEFPEDDHHGWKFIAFGPDGKLYIPVGAPCNICERLDNPVYASITRMNDDGSGLEVFAHGVRNAVGFAW